MIHSIIESILGRDDGWPLKFTRRVASPSAEVTSNTIRLSVAAGTIFTCSVGATFRYRLPGGVWSGWGTSYEYVAGGVLYVEIKGQASGNYFNQGVDLGVVILTLISTSGAVVVDHDFVITTEEDDLAGWVDSNLNYWGDSLGNYWGEA